MEENAMSENSPNSNPIRVGLIGYGFAGKSFHAPLIHAVPGLSLDVFGTSRHEAVLADYPRAVVCPPEQVVEHPHVDLVVIATPNESHFPLAAAALRNGKDVVVDKPFTLDLAEARELVAIATEHKRLLSVFQNRRFYSEVLATKAILASGQLGEVSHYESHMDRFRPLVRQRWREIPGPGAGLWFDLGPHLIDQALHLFGMPDSVSASFAALRPGAQTDDWAHVVLNYPQMRAILHASLLVSWGTEPVSAAPRSALHGTKASWAKFGIDPQESQSIAGMLPTDPAFGVDPDPGILYDGATGQKTQIPVPVGDQRIYYAGVRDAIVNGTAAPISGEHGVAVMAVLEATFASGAEGRTRAIPLTAEERVSWDHFQRR
jgi:predicted dehydrogenase